MKITHNVAFNFHLIFIFLNLLIGTILDFGLEEWILQKKNIRQDSQDYLDRRAFGR
jgi:hypothetical protein